MNWRWRVQTWWQNDTNAQQTKVGLWSAGCMSVDCQRVIKYGATNGWDIKLSRTARTSQPVSAFLCLASASVLPNILCSIGRGGLGCAFGCRTDKRCLIAGGNLTIFDRARLRGCWYYMSQSGRQRYLTLESRTSSNSKQVQLISWLCENC